MFNISAHLDVRLNTVEVKWTQRVTDRTEISYQGGVLRQVLSGVGHRRLLRVQLEVEV